MYISVKLGCPLCGWGLLSNLNLKFTESADEYKAEKEDMILKSDSNSTWSSEDDVPPQIIVNSQHNSKKLEPLLEPLKYNKPTKA